MEGFSSRTVLMLGEDGYGRLSAARVAVFGIGGVGGYAVEALARAGVGELVLVDSDRVTESNINRQIIATVETVGKYKTEAAKERILSINPDCRVEVHNLFFGEECAHLFDFSKFDYIIDAIDSVRQKVALIRCATEAGTKIISAMGAGNKLDPTRFRVADISKTTVCPLAKAVRTSLRKLGINHLKVVFSDEPPCGSLTEGEAPSEQSRIPSSLAPNQSPDEPPLSKEHSGYVARRSPGSISFVPSVMGLILAGEVIKDIAGINA